MGKRVIKLTEQELHDMIQECVGSIQSGMDGKTYASLQQPAQQDWLKDFVGKTFKFFAKDRLQLTTHLLFTFEKITKIDLKKTILVGTVVFNNQQINGDGIIVDFTTGKVKWHERGSRHYYALEIDNRFKPLWDGLLEQIKMTLDNNMQ